MIQLNTKHENEQLTAQCILDEKVIYEKEFKLEKINNIKMYPCAENGDGKTLYWYGMELTDFQEGAVQYGTSLSFSGGTCTKLSNSLYLNFNDSDYKVGHGIGVNCKEDLTNYNSVDIKIESVESTGFVVGNYVIGNLPNNYYSTDIIKGENSIGEGGSPYLSDGIKNINISAITGEKYINILYFNPSGSNPNTAYGSCLVYITEIVLR